MFSILKPLLYIFFDKLVVLLWVLVCHVIEHLPNIIGHIDIFLILEAEYILQVFRNHQLNNIYRQINIDINNIIEETSDEEIRNIENIIKNDEILNSQYREKINEMK